MYVFVLFTSADYSTVYFPKPQCFNFPVCQQQAVEKHVYEKVFRSELSANVVKREFQVLSMMAPYETHTHCLLHIFAIAHSEWQSNNIFPCLQDYSILNFRPKKSGLVRVKYGTIYKSCMWLTGANPLTA
jgi:hypothetical protein